MKSASLSKLVIVTAVVVAGALWAWQSRGSGPPPEQGRLFVPSFDEQINDAALITLTSAEGTLTLRRQEGEWGLGDWDGYPADFEKVKQTLMGLAGLKIVEAKTAKAEKHAQLGLQDPGVEGAESLDLAVASGDGSGLADIVLGKQRVGHDDQLYARRAGEDQTWLVSGALAPPREASGWVDKELLRLPAAEMVRVEVSHPDGEQVELTQDASGTWALANTPDGRVVKSGASFAALAGALAYLDMESVVPASEQGDAEPQWTRTFWQRKDGLEVTVNSAEVGDERWLRIAVAAAEPVADDNQDSSASGADVMADEMADVMAAASVDEMVDEMADSGSGENSSDGAAVSPDAADAESSADAATAATETAAEAAAAKAAAAEAAEKAAAEAAQKLADEVSRLSERLEGWTYRVPSWKADALRKHLEDFLEPLPEPAPVVGPPAPEVIEPAGTEIDTTALDTVDDGLATEMPAAAASAENGGSAGGSSGSSTEGGGGSDG